MRIDAHVHYTPPSLAADLPAYSEREPYAGFLFSASPVNHTKQGWATPERMIEDMDRAGLDRVVVQGSGQSHETCVQRNNLKLALMNRWPDRVIGFAGIQPKAGQKALDELARCLDAGMLGVGELGPYGQGYALDHPDFLRAMEACIDYGVPVNLHVSEEIGHYYFGKSVDPMRSFYGLAVRYPELKLILSHWGGGLLFFELMPEVRRELENVFYDMAASPLLFPTDAILKTALHCTSHKKILYGSDYPLLICPTRQDEPDFRPFIAEIEKVGLGQEIMDDIMGNNAARLMGLVPAEDGQDVAAPASATASRVITEIRPGVGFKIDRFMSVSAVAAAWPQTHAVFERYDIPYRDRPVPFWEPIAQSAAARGWEPQAQQRLLDELNEAIG